jgi:HTH-type transcriptional regulator/antitoxin HipB
MLSASASHPLVTALQLSQLLKSARKQRQLTQAELAARLGLSQNRVSYLESHPQDLSVKQLLGWCAALGLELTLGQRPTATPDSDAGW